MKNYLPKATAFILDEDGATAVEYGLMVALILVAIMSAVAAIGTNINSLFTGISEDINK